jgi:hypothetical protein
VLQIAVESLHGGSIKEREFAWYFLTELKKANAKLEPDAVEPDVWDRHDRLCQVAHTSDGGEVQKAEPVADGGPDQQILMLLQMLKNQRQTK